jgi:MoaA/NifB/PqqE/SkfB family radical SAM enzyme
MLSNTYCSVLWNHQFIDGSGRIKPCCRFKETENNNINSTTIEDVFYSDTMKQRRGHSLRGDPIEGCRRCYEEELNGKKSLRQRYNDNEYLKPKDLNNPKVEWLELAISNECNLACRMCDSRYSTKWFDEEFEFVGKATPLTKINIAQVYPFVPTLKHLKITGGEPFVTPDHWRLLDYIIEHDYAKNIYLNYSTNCTVYPKESIVERLRQFKWVEVALSLDSIVAEEFTSAEAKAQCEYILRYMRSKDDPQDEFLKHTYFLDKSRKQSFADVYSYFCILSKQISEMLTS